MGNELFPRGKSDFKDRVVEIYRYREGDELACNRCGSVDDIAAFEIYEQLSSTGVLMARCDCHECGKYVKYLPMSSLAKFWNCEKGKDGRAVTASELTGNLLIWYCTNFAKRGLKKWEVDALFNERRQRGI